MSGAARKIASVAAVVGVFWCAYAILGLQLYNGLFYFCNDPQVRLLKGMLLNVLAGAHARACVTAVVVGLFWCAYAVLGLYRQKQTAT